MFTSARIFALRYTERKLSIIFCLTLSFSEEVHILFPLVIKQFLMHWLAQVQKGLFDLYILITESHWGKSVRNWSRNKWRNHGGTLITVFPHTLFAQDVSFYKQGSHSSLWHNSQWVSLSHINHLSIKCMHRLAQRPVWWMQFLKEGSLCPGVSSFCKVDKNYSDVDKNTAPDVKFIVINRIIKYSCTPKKINYSEFRF